jgi:hypothetical protein
MPSIDLAALRAAVQENRYRISKHAQQRMGLRKVTHADLKHVITEGEVVEEYPDNRPDPKVLLMAFVQDEPLYVSCAFDGSYAYIITVHRYDPTRWVDPWTRKE